MPRSQIEDDVNGVSSAFVQHEPVDVFFDEPSRTRQEFAEECDINVLMARFEKTGVISHVAAREPLYLDLSEGVPDLQSALNMVKAAEAAFMTLPASVRREFDNDPVRFVAFAEDPANLERMREWGLAKPAPEEPAAQAPSPAVSVPAPAPAG